MYAIVFIKYGFSDPYPTTVFKFFFNLLILDFTWRSLLFWLSTRKLLHQGCKQASRPIKQICGLLTVSLTHIHSQPIWTNFILEYIPSEEVINLKSLKNCKLFKPKVTFEFIKVSKYTIMKVRLHTLMY